MNSDPFFKLMDASDRERSEHLRRAEDRARLAHIESINRSHERILRNMLITAVCFVIIVVGSIYGLVHR